MERIAMDSRSSEGTMVFADKIFFLLRVHAASLAEQVGRHVKSGSSPSAVLPVEDNGCSLHIIEEDVFLAEVGVEEYTWRPCQCALERWDVLGYPVAYSGGECISRTSHVLEDYRPSQRKISPESLRTRIGQRQPIESVETFVVPPPGVKATQLTEQRTSVLSFGAPLLGAGAELGEVFEKQYRCASCWVDLASIKSRDPKAAISGKLAVENNLTVVVATIKADSKRARVRRREFGNRCMGRITGNALIPKSKADDVAEEARLQTISIEIHMRYSTAQEHTRLFQQIREPIRC